jgi:methylthioribose-1-phosphate isomerase
MDLPLLAWTAKLQENSFNILDETQLPERLIYVNVKDYREAAEVIRSMKTRAFGQLLAVLYAMIITARNSTQDSLLDQIEDAARVLNTSRPTFAFSQYTSLVVKFTKEALIQHELQPSRYVEERITDLLEKIKAMRIKRAALAAGLFDDGDHILTHCNTSGELLLMAQFCRNAGKNIKMYATETRPYFQGRLTSWEMSCEGFDVTLIPDNRVAGLIKNGLVNKAVTGSDRVALNGDIVNKTGTFQIALAAKKFGIPFYAFVQDPGETKTGDDIRIEFRNADELTIHKGMRLYPSFVNAFYPAFDVTPGCYIDKLITFDKIISPQDLPDGWGKNKK